VRIIVQNVVFAESFRPMEALRRASPVAVHATDIALRDLVSDHSPTATPKH